MQGRFWGVSQVSRNWSGFLCWHIMPIYSNKAIKVYGQYSNKTFVTRLITPFSMFILVHFCLSREDLEEDQRDPKPHISPASNNLVNLCSNSIKCNFYIRT